LIPKGAAVVPFGSFANSWFDRSETWFVRRFLGFARRILGSFRVLPYENALPCAITNAYGAYTAHFDIISPLYAPGFGDGAYSGAFRQGFARIVAHFFENRW
jgi:hypothetical protein